MYGHLTREVRLDSTSQQCACNRLRERIPASGASAPCCAESQLCCRGGISLWFAPGQRTRLSLWFIQTHVRSTNTFELAFDRPNKRRES